LAAIVLTHGHEDHIGAVPYLVRSCPVPIYGPPYALALVRERCAEAQVEIDHLVRPFVPGDRVHAGPFEIEPYRSRCRIARVDRPHPAGVVVHSGDFKMIRPTDATLIRSPAPPARRGGVRVLLSDSTNALAPGSSGAERDGTRARKAREDAPARRRQLARRTPASARSPDRARA
jgi:ribonuclease J